MPRARRKPSAPKVEAIKIKVVSPATIRRLREDAISNANDPRRGYELGRLALREAVEVGSGITSMQESAGLRYAKLRERWRAVTGIRSPNGNAQDYRRVVGFPAESSDEVAEAVEAAMRSADDALDHANGGARKAVEMVCDRDTIIVGHQMLLDLRRGLDALAVEFGMVR